MATPLAHLWAKLSHEFEGAVARDLRPDDSLVSGPSHLRSVHRAAHDFRGSQNDILVRHLKLDSRDALDPTVSSRTAPKEGPLSFEDASEPLEICFGHVWQCPRTRYTLHGFQLVPPWLMTYATLAL